MTRPLAYIMLHYLSYIIGKGISISDNQVHSDSILTICNEYQMVHNLWLIIELPIDIRGLVDLYPPSQCFSVYKKGSH